MRRSKKGWRSMNSKAYGYLPLARRGRLLEIGEEPVGAVCRAQHARLVILASNASGHAVRRAKSFVAGTKQPVLQISCTKEELGAAVGRSDCAMAVFTDVRLALAFVQALDENERPVSLLQDLEERAARAAQRQKEEKAHQNNLRRGKRKK